MTLEAFVHQQNLFGYCSKEAYSHLEGKWSCEFGFGGGGEEEGLIMQCLDNNNTILDESQTENNNYFYPMGWDSTTPTEWMPQWGVVPVDPTTTLEYDPSTTMAAAAAAASAESVDYVSGSTSTTSTVGQQMSGRAKKRRPKTSKNKQEIENQRMTHIAVERNRRKQMNDYLSVLRSLMPESYVQRGDQASIVGGAINYVKELEQQKNFLDGYHNLISQQQLEENNNNQYSLLPFSEFFTFPQYSTSDVDRLSSAIMTDPTVEIHQQSAIADIEVTMVDSHANLKIRYKRRRTRQSITPVLRKMASELQILRLNILHLNVTTVDEAVLFSLSLKVEVDCELSSADEIATAVNQMLGRIQEDSS